MVGLITGLGSGRVRSAEPAWGSVDFDDDFSAMTENDTLLVDGTGPDTGTAWSAPTTYGADAGDIEGVVKSANVGALNNTYTTALADTAPGADIRIRLTLGESEASGGLAADKPVFALFRWDDSGASNGTSNALHYILALWAPGDGFGVAKYGVWKDPSDIEDETAWTAVAVYTASSTGAEVAVGDVLEVRCYGDTFDVYLNDVLKATGTDSSYAGGSGQREWGIGAMPGENAIDRIQAYFP